MELRRRYTGRHTLQVELRHTPTDEWVPTTQLVAFGYPSPFNGDWEARHALRYGALLGGPALPFQPLSVTRVTPAELPLVGSALNSARRLPEPVISAATSFAQTATDMITGLLGDRAPADAVIPKPEFELGNPMTLVPSGTTITIPSYSGALAYEPALGFVISETLLDATPEQAQKAIVAFVAVCDFTAVELQSTDGALRPRQPKQFAGSLSASAVRAATVGDGWRELTGTVELNGTVAAKVDGRMLPKSLGEIVALASAGEALSAGELFTVPLPGGSSTGGRRLKRGDAFVLELDGIGRIEHSIA